MNEELKIYGFGSFFSGYADFQDIDILFVHRSGEYESCQFAIWCKRMFILKLIEADITILSEREEQQFSFIAKSRACRIGKICEDSAENDLVSVLRKIGQVANLKDKKQLRIKRNTTSKST